ncbi:MAG: tRNA (adenine-N1)-methyltransferase [Caldilineaceae bacterium]|nr:tRNA (adenine-N1)-methyltransferase [Caldilineaceae bacterium]
MTATAEPQQSTTSGWFGTRGECAQADDLVLLITSDQKRYLVKLKPRQRLHTHWGVFDHDDLIGQPFGAVVASRIEHRALLLEPSLSDLIKQIKRGTQIIYPKDAAYLVHRMSLRAGSRVIEAGTGSAGLTIALAWAVAPTGIVYTYETRPDIYSLARRNLERVDLLRYVEMFQATILDGFRQKNADALFLDVREPWLHLDQVSEALRPGGFFASLIPTTNQVSDLIAGLERKGFADISVEELLLRGYKAAPERLRPDDAMVAHTGFLVFARSVVGMVDASEWHAKERKRFRARQRAQEKIAADEAQRAQEEADGGRKYPPLPLPG